MRICWGRLLWWAVVIVLGTAAMLDGCGAKGPLYLPNQGHHQSQEK